jgi:hypothetical protein
VTGALLEARLRSARNRVRFGGWGLVEAAVVLAGVLAAAAWQGHALSWELFARSGGPAAAWPVLREWIYVGVAVQCMVVAYAAMEALLRPPDGPLLLTLPVGPGPRYAAATVDAALRALAAPAVLAAFAAPLSVLGAWEALTRSLALALAGYGVAVLCGLGLAALAGRAAASPHGRALKAYLSGRWVAPDRAPFLYAPAVAGGAAAVLAVALQVSLDDWPADPAAAAVGTGFAGAIAVALWGAGAWSYARGFARLGPLLESLDARYPLSPQAGLETSVYGAALAACLPGLTGAVAARDLLSIRRRHRAEPVMLLLLGAATALLLLRAEAGERAWATGGIALGLFAARSGVRLGEADVEVGWLTRALPLRFGALLGAKVAVALFHAAHAVLPFSVGAAAAGAGGAAAWCAVVAALASGFGPALALACAGRPGLARGLYLSVAAGLCLGSLAFPALVPALLAALALGAAWRARGPALRGLG